MGLWSSLFCSGLRAWLLSHILYSSSTLRTSLALLVLNVAWPFRPRFSSCFLNTGLVPLGLASLLFLTFSNVDCMFPGVLRPPYRNDKAAAVPLSIAEFLFAFKVSVCSSQYFSSVTKSFQYLYYYKTYIYLFRH